MAEPTKPRRVAVPKKGVTPRGRVAMPVDPARSTGDKAKAKAAQNQKVRAKIRNPKASANEPNGKAIGRRRQTPATPGPETAAVRKKYESTLAMRKEAAAGKGAKGKAGLIAWKRSSGYQKDWNAAKANDIANDSSKRPVPMPTGPVPEQMQGPKGTQHTMPNRTANDMQSRIKAAGLAPKAMPKRKTSKATGG